MTASDFPSGFLDALDDAVMARNGSLKRNEIRFRCPSPDHDDTNPSSRWNRTKAVWTCDACGAGGGALNLAELLGVAKPPRRGGGGVHPPGPPRTGAHPLGCTLAAYAEAKGIPEAALRAFGLDQISYLGAPVVRMPYRDQTGSEAAIRYRVALTKSAEGDNRFKWKQGAKPRLYGLDRLDFARERGYVVLGEGESDCHTLWHLGEPAVGVPGAANWNEARDAPQLDGIPVIYAVVEPDGGGEAFLERLAVSAIRDRVWLVRLGGDADPSGLYLSDPETFAERWAAAKAAAVRLVDELAAAERAAAAAAWEVCVHLAREPDILGAVARTLAAAGVAGEARTLKLLYLIVTTRVLPRPASAAIKGPSSGGKSYALEQVLALFPPDAYYALTAMSERALAYGTEPLAHRFLVIYEAAGLAGDFASYLVRSLLSEGRVRYETVEKTAAGLVARTIEREGPTGLLVTTTAVHLHPENETRLLSIPVTDTRDQTRDVFRALASEETREPDWAPWHALQTWIAGAEHRATVPYAAALAELIPPVAVRLRRDFGLLLVLIRGHAILHQATRERDAEGRVVATLDDYAAVRTLVADLVADGVEATVPPTLRETVEAVRALVAPARNAAGGESLRGKVTDDGERTASLAQVTAALKIDRSAASRRVRVAKDRGYLKDLEDRKGRPAKIALGDPLPDELEVLPKRSVLAEQCTVAGDPGGKGAPPPTDETGVDDGVDILITVRDGVVYEEFVL